MYLPQSWQSALLFWVPACSAERTRSVSTDSNCLDTKQYGQLFKLAADVSNANSAVVRGRLLIPAIDEVSGADGKR
jgi:hypothetical protein